MAPAQRGSHYGAGRIAVVAILFLCATAAALSAEPQGSDFGDLARGAASDQNALHARLWQTVTLQVNAVASPVITSFTANPPAIISGQSSTLSWITANASNTTISGVGSVPATGSTSVAPAVTTTYTLTATSPAGSATASTTVAVTPGGPRVIVTSFPSGIVQPADQSGGSATFVLANVGTATTTVTLSANGGFFTVSPVSFDLAPGGAQGVAITTVAKPAGSYQGSVGIAGQGVIVSSVDVRLLSATPPSGTVLPQPTAARAEISAPSGQAVSGSVAFTNKGSSIVTAIATADVPWITPQGGVITIPPGGTVSVAFTIDPSQRPDAGSPLGAVTGNLSLTFLTGSATGPATTIGTATGSSSSVSISLVYVVAPGTEGASPQPLQPGEVALFLSGLGNRSAETGDVLLLNKALNSDVNGLNLYLLSPSDSPALASIARLPAGASALFPGFLKNVFHANSAAGSLQVRTSDVSKVSVAGVQSNNSSPRGTFGTQLPVLRSDRGVPAGGQILLPGLQKQTGTHTDVYLQEVSGMLTTVNIDFLDTNGATVSSRTAVQVMPFAMLELLDAVPAGAIAARVTNNLAGRVYAFGLVVDEGSGDLWVSTDPQSDDAAAATVIVPLIPASTAADTSVYLTNRSNSPVSAKIDLRVGSGRRRAVGRSAADTGSTTAPPVALSDVSMSPLQTIKLPLSSAAAGYLRITYPAGSVSATGRSLLALTGASGSFGTGLPAVPVSAAIGVGDIKRFAGVDEASAATRTAKKPGTFRSSLLLIETANAPATVRVTLHYTFAAGSLVSAEGISSRQYFVGPSGALMITELANEILGAQRAAFGDLHGMAVDIEVIDGGGRIIPVVRSIDNGSEDVVVRTD